MKVKLFDKNCKPFRAYPTDSGLDLRARINKSVIIEPFQTIMIPTGIAVELPRGFEGQIRPRSSFSKRGISTTFGTIDNSYRGEIKVTLINTSMERFEILPYERIAQLVIAPIIIPELEFVEELSQTQRGDRGHGSTGRI